MIVNLQQQGWEIIYHRAHALLAAQIASHWNNRDSPQKIIDTIAAISHHDDLEKEWEEDRLTEAGAPLDFMLQQETPVEKLDQLVEDALYRGRWVALLVSMHMSYLYSSVAEQSAEMREFLDRQQQLQQQWRKDLGLSKDQAHNAYRFMEWCDRLSLILCQRQLPVDERALEISTGPGDRSYKVIQRKDDTVTVEPWPFASAQFKVDVEASYLSQLKFDSNDALTEALKVAPRKQIEWKFHR